MQENQSETTNQVVNSEHAEEIAPVETQEEKHESCATSTTETVVGTSTDPSESNNVLQKTIYENFWEKERSYKEAIAALLFLLVVAIYQINSCWQNNEEMRLLVPPITKHAVFGDKNSPRVEKIYDDFPHEDIAKTYKK